MLPSPRKTILVVEDASEIGEGIQELFEDEGYPVLLAKHGQAALDLLALRTLAEGATPKIGLVLLDLMMPVMDGFTFLAELERSHPTIFAETPIFVMSARTDTHKVAAKVTGVMKKPLDLDELLQVAARYCAP